MINIFFFRTSCRLCDNVDKYGTARQITDGNIIRRMRGAYWLTKAKDTHSEYVILIAFPLQQWVHATASILRYTYIACLVNLLKPTCYAMHHQFNPLNAELNPICYLLALLAHHFLHVSRIRVKSLTLRLVMSIYMEHLFLMFLDHTQRRSTVGRTPLDE